ncbi:hypothetical protein QYM36_019890 [Artemia franciscana]|uniref:Uncharacterized protein n=1 Tax=Artemia franciscana TaxID=6661 RepID=A0AA88KSS5_ARTSF|nr:hypothetical protein QYM36_019890 [Artemia franciscana]
MNLKWNELSSWDTVASDNDPPLETSVDVSMYLRPVTHDEVHLSSYKPLYGPKDLFDLLLSLKDQQQITRLERKWSVVVSGIDVTDLQKIVRPFYRSFVQTVIQIQLINKTTPVLCNAFSSGKLMILMSRHYYILRPSFDFQELPRFQGTLHPDTHFGSSIGTF